MQLLCALDAIPDGASRGFDPGGTGRDTMFVVRRGPRVFAYRNACPHYDRARMAWKKDEFLSGDRQHIMCAGHAALFDIETGACVICPCMGQSLFPVALIQRDGMIFLPDQP